MKNKHIILLLFIIISFISLSEEKNPLAITNIDMKNFEHLPYEIVTKDLSLKKDEIFSTEKLRKDYKSLKSNKYIKDFTIYPEIYQEGLQIVIEIEEVENIVSLLEEDDIIPLSERDRLDRSLIVKSIRISGNEQIDKEVIEKEIDINIGSYFSKTKILANKEKILQLGYFKDVSTEVLKYKDGIYIVFNVLENPVIKGIKISGNSLIDSKVLKEEMKTEVGEVYNINTLTEDRNRILKKYSEKGYVLASIYDMRLDNNLNLSIKISEGIIKDIKYKTILKTALEEDAIAEIGNVVVIDYKGKINKKSFSGGQASDFELELGSKTFIPGFEEQIIGHMVGDEFEVNVTFPEDYPTEKLAGKPAVFEVTLNEIKEVDTVESSELKTKEFVINREIVLKKGEPFKIDKFQTSMKNLFRLGYFKEIKHQFERIEDDPQSVHLVLLFDENKTGSISGGVTYSSGVGVVGNISVEDKNFFGRSQTLGLKLEITPNSEKNIELNFSDPWVRGTKRLSYSVGVYDTSIDSESDSNSNTRRTGGRFSIGKGITKNTRISLGTKYEKIETENDDTTIESYKKWSVYPSFYYDTRNNVLDATEGFYSKSSFEYGVIFDNDNYSKLEQEFRKYHKFLADKNYMAYRMVIGGATESTPSDEIFGVGGSNTLRGYDYGDYLGTKTIYANIENRFRIEDNVQLVLFCDIGRAWEDFDRFIKLDNIQASYGGGFRLSTPLGQFRLDYGVPITEKENSEEDAKKGKWHFSIGQLF